MLIRLLGPVSVVTTGGAVVAGKPQQCLVLAALALDAGCAVPVEALIDRVWGPAPPAQARRTLHTYVTRIRRLLEQTTGPVRLSRGGGGYLLDVARSHVDLLRFADLLDAARDPACGENQRASRLRDALALWRGRPLAGLDGWWAGQVREAWIQQHLEAVVMWAETEIASGSPTATFGTLTELLEEHPLVERLTAALMRALHAAGRTAQALQRYTQTRQRLIDELGIEPGSELQELHRSILGGAATRDELVPAQLPRDLLGFCGRNRELSTLDRQLHDAGQAKVILVSGMAGVGKTALALHWAHRVRSRFPDGQIFLDLHGHTSGVAPVAPADALDRTLRVLGIPGQRIPRHLEDLAALWRSLLAGRRVLIVLDNAAHEAQVEPLLPGVPGCLVLITTRHRLTGLDDAVRLPLDVLPLDDGRLLFTTASGHTPPAGLAAEIVELCGRLPLAIRVAAARLKTRPGWAVEQLAGHLRDHGHRLAELETGRRSVTVALDLSCQHLAADRLRCYRLLGLHPGPDFDCYAAAALADTGPEQMRRLLGDLIDAHLLTEPDRGRYRFHDLVRDHAAHLCKRDEPEAGREAAADRLLAHYAYTASVAMDRVYPHETDRRPAPPQPHTVIPPLPDAAEATSWLDGELTNLLASTRCDRPAHTVALSAILHRHLRIRGQGDAAQRLHQDALDAARALADRTGELRALINLGDTLGVRSELEPADQCLQQALAIARDLGDGAAEIAALLVHGAIAYYQARHDLATERLEQVLRIARATGHTRAELRALGNLGNIHRLHGRHEAATTCYENALAIARAIGDRNDEIKSLVGVGHMYRLGKKLDAAGRTYRDALTIARATGDREAELLALWGVGTVDRALGRTDDAIACFGELLELARRGGNRNSEFEACHGLGHAHRAAGRPEEAITHHELALQLARGLGQPDDEARARDGLALAHEAVGHQDEASEHWHAALAILTGLGLTEVEETNVDDIRTRLCAMT